MRYLLLLCWLVACPPAAFAQRPAAAVSAATVARVVTTLAADELQGRATGQPGNQRAAEFLAAEFRRIGLLPLPGTTSLLQEFPALETTVTSLHVTLNGTPLPAGQALVVTTQARLHWTSLDSVTVLVITSPQELDAHFDELAEPTRNQLVLLAPASADRFAALAAELRGRRIHPAPSPYACVVAVAPASPLTTCQVVATATTRPLQLRNVVGYLPGHDPARHTEYVLFSGHYDHLGILAPVAGDSIANGANDDASGTTAVVALAEYFQRRHDNARPLLFAAFTAEEIGFYGSRYFAQHLDPRQLVAVFNMELIGRVPPAGPRTAFITGYDKSDFGQLLQASLRGSRFQFQPDPYPAFHLFYRADNLPFAQLGVPAHTLSTDDPPTDTFYHTVHDELRTLDLPHLTAVIAAIAQSARGIVAGQQTPRRITGVN
jgi:hypothetical protein